MGQFVMDKVVVPPDLTILLGRIELPGSTQAVANPMYPRGGIAQRSIQNATCVGPSSSNPETRS
jgi:hypothetical protein